MVYFENGHFSLLGNIFICYRPSSSAGGAADSEEEEEDGCPPSGVVYKIGNPFFVTKDLISCA